MTDDGAGLEALSAFQEGYDVAAEGDFLDGGTLGLELLVYMEGYGRILVADCVTTGREPGTVVRIEGEDVPVAFSKVLSPHQMGLKDLLSVLELQGRMPERLTVLGVEPESIEMGLDLSEPVRRSLPKLVGAMAGVLGEWGVEARPRSGGCPG